MFTFTGIPTNREQLSFVPFNCFAAIIDQCRDLFTGAGFGLREELFFLSSCARSSGRA